MKQKDWIIIGAVCFVSAILAFVVSNAIFGSPQKHPIKVPVVEKISTNFPSPQTDENYKPIYNDQALNPTQLIQIGGSNNTAPFQGGEQ